LIVACAILAAGTVSCAGKSAEQPVESDLTQDSQDTGFSIPAAGSLVMMLDPDGQLAMLPGLADGPAASVAPGQNPGAHPIPNQGPQPAPFAIQTAVAAVQAPVDGGAVVAINRIGLVYLSILDRQVQVRRIPGADPEFAGRSVAQAWTWDGKAMFLLHRNEIFETMTARNPVGRIIAATAAGARALPAFGIDAEAAAPENATLHGSPYAVFPRTATRWLMQFRLVDDEKTLTAFAAWEPGMGKSALQTPLELLERDVYEAEVRPGSIREAPSTLQRAAEALGGSLLIDAIMPDGSQQAWMQGSSDAALAVRARVSATSAVALASDGRIVVAESDGTCKIVIKPPVPRAYFRDLAILDDFIIVVWEEDLFPDLGSSGLVIMDRSLLKDGPVQPRQN
jgi:hypothetical protein